MTPELMAALKSDPHYKQLRFSSWPGGGMVRTDSPAVIDLLRCLWNERAMILALLVTNGGRS